MTPHVSSLLIMKYFRMKRQIQSLLLLLLLQGAMLSAQSETIQIGAPESSWPAQLSEGVRLGRTLPLSEVQRGSEIGRILPPSTQIIEKKQYFGSNELKPGAPGQGKPDPVIQSAQPEVAPQIRPILNISGLYNTGSEPPDPTGDIGKNHYIQMVNASNGSRMRIMDKQGLTLFEGPSSDICSMIIALTGG
jgi:hypothetical protein